MSEVYNLSNETFDNIDDAAEFAHNFFLINKTGDKFRSSFANSQCGEDLVDLILGENRCVPRSSLVNKYSLQGFFRMLLDEGFIPRLLNADAILSFPERLSKFLNEGTERDDGLQKLMLIKRFHFEAERMPLIYAPDFDGVAFLVCTHGDPMTIKHNLEESVDFNDSKNERYVIRGAKSPAEVYHAARHSKKKLFVNIHDDLYVPKNWSKRIWQQFFDEDKKSPVGIAGLFGVSGNRDSGSRQESGLVVDLMGMRTLGKNWCVEQTRVLDGLCLITKNGSGITPKTSLGWHFYDADMCMQAEATNQRVISLFAPALHSSYVLLPPKDFESSMVMFKNMWPAMLPVETPCALAK